MMCGETTSSAVSAQKYKHGLSPSNHPIQHYATYLRLPIVLLHLSC